MPPERRLQRRSGIGMEVFHELTGAPGDYDPLLDLIGEARFVLLGEASHGTHEFYLERSRITRRLIAEKGFSAVVEGDWPSAARVNRSRASSASRPGCGAMPTSCSSSAWDRSCGAGSARQNA